MTPPQDQGTQKPIFSREAIEAKQKEALDQFQRQMHEMRKALEETASTNGGMRILKFLFLASGGGSTTVRRGKDEKVDMQDTLMAIGAKGVYEALRINMSTETLMKIERQPWEK